MEYVPPINGDTEDPDRSYINANPSTSTEGSIPPAEAIEHPQREIIAAIEAAGLTPDSGDLTQLAQAITELATGGDMYKADNLSGLADYAVARANMGILQRKGTTIASAATTNIGAADSHYVSVSGNSTITSLGTGTDRDFVIVEFTGTPVLTHHATNLPLPNDANITVEAGDKAIFARRGSAGTAQWDLINYFRKSGSPLVPGLIQRKYQEYTTYGAIGTIDYDDTIPQNTEGTEILSQSITPKNASNIIRVTVQANIGNSATGVGIVAVFKDSDADAIFATGNDIQSANQFGIVSGVFEFVAGSTSAMTLSVRVGTGSGSGKINGINSGRLFGGVLKSTLVIEEIKA